MTAEAGDLRHVPTHFEHVMKLNELSFEIGATDLLRFVLRRIDRPRP